MKNILFVPDEIRQHLQGDAFEALMQMPGKAFRDVPGRKTIQVNLGGKNYFIKQHFGVGWGEIFKNLLTLKTPILGAMTEVSAIKKLDEMGLATTPLVAYGQRGCSPASMRSFVMTEDLGDIVSLEDICKTWVTHPPSQAQRQAMLIAVAKLAKRFHGAGLSHRDFYLCHIALQREIIVTADTEFYLLDLHRVLQHQSVHGSAVRKDIAGLMFSCMDYGFTAQDWEMFKTHYLPQATKFWQQVYKRANKLYARFNSDKFQKRVRAEKEAVDLIN